jgi:hypothetical protein
LLFNMVITENGYFRNIFFSCEYEFFQFDLFQNEFKMNH